MNTNNFTPPSESKWWVVFLLIVLAGAITLGLLVAKPDFLSPSTARRTDAETEIYKKNEIAKLKVVEANAEAEAARIKQAPEIEAGWYRVGMNVVNTAGTALCVTIGAAAVIFAARLALHLLPKPVPPVLNPVPPVPPPAQPEADEWVRALRTHQGPSSEARVREYWARRNGTQPGRPVQTEAQPMIAKAESLRKAFSNNGHGESTTSVASAS